MNYGLYCPSLDPPLIEWDFELRLRILNKKLKLTKRPIEFEYR
jgi:hypothetical protein